MMIKNFFSWVLISVIWFSFPGSVGAFWVWTPERNRWVNPRNTVKPTPAGQLELALELYRAREFDQAGVELKKLINHYPRAQEAAEAQFYLGVIADEEGNYSRAFRHYQAVVDQYPFSERFGEIIQRQYGIGVKLLEGKGRRVFFQGASGTDALVVEIFRTVIKNSPYGQYAAPAQYNIAVYLQEQGLLPEARDEFEKTINDYPDTEWARNARYQIALADAKRSSGAPYEQKVTRIAIQGLEGVVSDIPEGNMAREAEEQIRALKEKEAQQHFLVAEFYEKRKEYRAAQIYYNKIVEEHPDTTWASRALEKVRAMNALIQP